MSIIQEALKKAQGADKTVKPSVTLRNVPIQAKRSSNKKSLLYIIIAVAAIVMITMIFIKHAASRKPAPVTSPALASAVKQALPPPIEKAAEEVPAPVEAPEPAIVEERAAPVLPVIPQEKELVLSGIMHLDGGSQAIVNNITVMEGDTIDGATVKKITDNSVVLKRNDAETILHLK